ncbi:catabolite control protein A [Pseudoflavonifractor sp. An85]|uniref:catabolite control protein A n=1 Tax=Pseudoflavonifractor sp. An85 TaxID=1965661 RepID=UPI000B36B363|nr:catabolite control protein A [Pseudoflavonifractor sp. An85]OUN23065.1 catabolite control protein A [Pseudoflavonifractor sp. An85]
MKTKLMSALLVLAMLSTLTACGGSNGNQPSSESSAPASEAPENTNETLGLFNKTATLDETVMVDEGGVKITATGLTYTNYSVEVGLTIENNSGKDLSFVSGSIGYSCNSVNGYMVEEGYLNCDVANGKKANDTIQFSYDTLMLYGIDEIADLEIGFDMSDDDYNHTYSGPRQLKTSIYDSHDYETNHYQATIASQAAQNTYGYEMLQFSQDALYEQNGVKMLSSGMMRRDGEDMLLLELENTTDSMVYVVLSDLGLNGLKLSSSNEAGIGIYPGKCGIMNVRLSSVLDQAYWSEYGMTGVGAVSLSLGQYNEDEVEIGEKVPVEITLPDGNATFDASGKEVYNSNGLRIVAKSVQEQKDSGDLFVLMLAENNSGKTLTLDDAYDSLSVNGFMTDYYCDSQELKNGESAALVIRLQESSLDENQITSASDVQEIEVGFEIQEGYTTIDEPTITLQFGE